MSANTAAKFILVVDDDSLLRQALQDILEISGYQVWAAAIAHDGLRILKAADQLPEVIISDFRLPGINGDQFFEQVQANVYVATHSVHFCLRESGRFDQLVGKLGATCDRLFAQTFSHAGFV